MTKIKCRQEGLSATLIYLLGGLLLLIQYRIDFNYEARLSFVSLILAYFYIAGLLLIAKLKCNLSVFEPLAFAGALYLATFVIKPVADLNAGKLYEHGIYVFDGAVKATLILMMSFTCLFLGYYGKHFLFCKRNYEPARKNEISSKSILDDMRFLLVCWIFLYLICIYCMHTQGISLRYIFSLGTRGEITATDANTKLLFLTNFGVTLLMVWLLILVKSKNNFLKFILSVLTAAYLIMRNARWLVLVMVVSPVTYYYLSRRRKPNLFMAAVGAVIMLIVFAWMQVNRGAIHAGEAVHGWGENGLTLGMLLSPLESDLSTYRTFYSMVMRYPSVHNYMLGSTFAYTFVLFIPRVIWHGKPDNPVRDMIENSLNSSARRAGTAVANIGEMYANFGILGCAALMYVLGIILTKMKKLMNSQGDQLIMYSLLYPLLFQWIARGNFSGNLYMTLFAVLPFIGAKILKRVHFK